MFVFVFVNALRPIEIVVNILIFFNYIHIHFINLSIPILLISLQISNNMSKFTLEIINKLSKYTSCDLSDSLVKNGIKDGGFIPNLVQFSPKSNSAIEPVSGYAYTALYAPLDDPRPAVKGGYIDKAPKDSIVVVGTTSDLQIPFAPYTLVTNALYGGLMSTRAQYLQCRGSVIIGRIRDVNEHRDLNYNVWSYGLGTTAPGSAVKLIGVNVPIEIVTGKTTIKIIQPGDFIVGDENGIVTLSAGDQEFVEKVIKAIPPRVEADTLVAQDIKNGIEAGKAQKHRRSAL